jgi:hypothetical protein
VNWRRAWCKSLPISETQVLEEASYAWDDGRKPESLRLLKLAVRKDPSLLAARLALAEHYRQMGHPDQAGRWGIIFDGWTTEIERDRLARLLASSGVGERDVMKFLSLADRDISHDVANLMSGPVERYRLRFRTPVRSTGDGCLDFVLFAVWGFTVLTSLGQFLSGPDASVLQVEKILGAVWMVGVTLALAINAARAARLARARRAIACTILAILSGALLLPSFFTGWDLG